MTVYPTKVDWWMWPALGMPILGFVGIVATGPGPSLLIALGTLAVFIGILAIFVFPMRYTISPAGIGIRYGVMKVEIGWDQVKRMGVSSSVLSSPALSLERIAIVYTRPAGNTATVRVSPVDRAGFLAEAQRYWKPSATAL